MTEETKQEITAALGLLKKTLIKNEVGVGIYTGKNEGRIWFFDTAEYYRSGKYNGVFVQVKNLGR